MSSAKGLKILRNLLSEYRQCSTVRKPQKSLLVQYILQQYRKYKVTDQQLCKAQKELNFMAESYLCYLQSQRRYEQILTQYHTKGERSICETASMVGFKLPHDPK